MIVIMIMIVKEALVAEKASAMMIFIIIVIILFCAGDVTLIVFVLVVPNIKVVPQARVYVVERLGSYFKTWQNGLHVKIPFVDRVANTVTLKEIVQITDAKLYTYGVENPINAIENLTATTLRNLIGELELDQTLTSRDIINTKMRSILDEATDPWGIKINRVEVKNIIPPRDIQEAMEKQMRAERERREKILQAEGEKKSSVLIAEGEKESAILRAEADKESHIKIAEGEAEAMLKIKQAEANGIRMLRAAEAEGINMLKQANPNEAVLRLKGFEALKDLADGEATKIIVPSDMQGIATLGTTLNEVLDKKNNN